MATKTLTIVRGMLTNLVKSGKFDRVLDKVYITSAGNGKLEAELTVCNEHSNRHGSLHGGLTATLVDQLSTMAAITSDPLNDGDNPQTGMSIDLSISYLRPVLIGDTIVIKSSTLKKGRTLAFIEVDIIKKDDGKLVAKGKHTKIYTCSRM